MDHNACVIFLHIHSEYFPKSFSFWIVTPGVADMLEFKNLSSSFTLKLSLSL